MRVATVRRCLAFALLLGFATPAQAHGSPVPFLLVVVESVAVLVTCVILWRTPSLRRYWMSGIAGCIAGCVAAGLVADGIRASDIVPGLLLFFGLPLVAAVLAIFVHSTLRPNKT